MAKKKIGQSFKSISNEVDKEAMTASLIENTAEQADAAPASEVDMNAAMQELLSNANTGRVSNQQPQLSVDDIIAQSFAPEVTSAGELNPETYYPNLRRNINVGQVQGSTIGSAPIFTPSVLFPFGVLDARQKALEQAAAEAVKPPKDFEKALEVPETAPQFQNKLSEDFVNFSDNAYREYAAKYGNKALKVMFSPGSKFLNDRQTYVDAARELKNLDDISDNLDKLRETQPDIYISGDTQTLMTQIKQGAQDVPGLIARKTNLTKELGKLQSSINIDQEIQTRVPLIKPAEFESALKQAMAGGLEYNKAFETVLSKTYSKERITQQASDILKAKPFFKDIYSQEDVEKQIQSYLANSTTRQTQIVSDRPFEGEKLKQDAIGSAINFLTTKQENISKQLAKTGDYTEKKGDNSLHIRGNVATFVVDGNTTIVPITDKNRYAQASAAFYQKDYTGEGSPAQLADVVATFTTTPGVVDNMSKTLLQHTKAADVDKKVAATKTALSKEGVFDSPYTAVEAATSGAGAIPVGGGYVIIGVKKNAEKKANQYIFTDPQGKSMTGVVINKNRFSTPDDITKVKGTAIGNELVFLPGAKYELAEDGKSYQILDAQGENYQGFDLTADAVGTDLAITGAAKNYAQALGVEKALAPTAITTTPSITGKEQVELVPSFGQVGLEAMKTQYNTLYAQYDASKDKVERSALAKQLQSLVTQINTATANATQ